jgi:iron complex transport system ATP-binding protein
VGAGVIEVEAVSVEIRGRRLLHDVSLWLEPGKVLAVLGPNGAGKSTLLRLLSGDLQASGGAIRMNGRALGAWGREAQARVRAVMLQDSHVPFAFTAEEVAMLGRAPHAGGSGRKRDRDIARAALACVDAGDLALRAFPTLSGGEKQRVQVARALAQVWEGEGEPRYLLLDEPTSSLDPRHQHVVLRQLRRLASEGAGAMVILHDLNLAAEYADGVVVLRAGAVVARGTVEEALTEDSLAAAFDLTMRVVRPSDRACPLIYSGGKNDDASQPEPR